jgi:hypothetical protein
VIIPLRNTGVGSPSIQFSGSPENVNRALAAISYKTRPFYNLLYRPPISQRGSLFDMTLDSSDGLIIIADDLGNSGAVNSFVFQTQYALCLDAFVACFGCRR